MNNKVLVRGLALAGLLGSIAMSQGEAEACHNSTVARVDPAVAMLKEAERLVDNGNPKDSVSWVHTAYPGAASKAPGAGLLSDKALSVLARATLRSDGQLAPRPTKNGDAQPNREENLRWAVETVQALEKTHSDDPAYAAMLGEALSVVPAQRGEALRVLQRLEKADIVASPFGYAALSRLRANAGEGKPAVVRGPLLAMSAGMQKLAKLRCETMSGDPGLCEGKPSKPAVPNVNVRLAAYAARDAADSINAYVTGRPSPPRAISVRSGR